MTAPSVRLRLLGVPIAGALLLSGCSGGDAADEPEAESTTAAGDYLDVPEGVELTALGSELEVGETATVAWQPDQKTVGALDITVTGMERASFKQFVGWNITEEIRANTPYFIHAEVTNAGDSDLGGERVPLYGVDADNLLLEAWEFPSTFKPCPSESLPQRFRPEDSTTTCLVVMAPHRGELVAASFRPDEEFAPIVWTGEVTRADEGGKRDRGAKTGKGSQRDEKRGEKER